MKSDRPDLVISDLLVELPRRTFTINVSDVQPDRLTLLEALDIVDASGTSETSFERIMMNGTARQKARLLYALAWVVARRVEPDLTYEEVCTYKLDVKGTPNDSEAAARKARAVVGVAALANVSTTEAKQMTMDEISALVELKKARPGRKVNVRRRRAS